MCLRNRGAKVCYLGAAMQGTLLFVSSFFTQVDLQLARLTTDSAYASMLVGEQ